MLIAHGPIAVLATKIANGSKIKRLRKTDLIILYAFSFFLGILPDFDIFYLASINKPAFLHHTLPTHTPILWISLLIIVVLILEYAKWPKSKEKRKIIYIAFIASTISHILADLIGGHIMFFTPFYSQYLTIFGNILPDNLFAGYFANPIFALEILFICICGVYLLFEFLNIKLFTFLALPIIYLIFNSYMYSKTYQVDLYKKENGNPIFDTDKDRLADSYDYDVDNNFIDNFRQVSKEELLTQFEKVYSSTTILPAPERDLSQRIHFIYGGHTILRAILQSYAQTGNYFPPVVHEYMNRNNIMAFSDALFPYLFSTNTFKKRSEVVDIKPGALVIAKYDKNTQYLGIVLRDKSVMIQDENGNPVTTSIDTISGEVFIQE